WWWCSSKRVWDGWQGSPGQSAIPGQASQSVRAPVSRRPSRRSVSQGARCGTKASSRTRSILYSLRKARRACKTVATTLKIAYSAAPNPAHSHSHTHSHTLCRPPLALLSASRPPVNRGRCCSGRLAAALFHAIHCICY
ncbi:hypothetical protein COCVIDRAFT_83440, partial [Bipolaris victoriae FI3]